MKIETFCGYK